MTLTTTLLSAAYERDTRLVCIHGDYVIAEKDPWDDDMKSCVLYVNPLSPPTTMASSTTKPPLDPRLRVVLHLMGMLRHMSRNKSSVGSALLCRSLPSSSSPASSWFLLQAWNNGVDVETSTKTDRGAVARVVCVATGEDQVPPDVMKEVTHNVLHDTFNVSSQLDDDSISSPCLFVEAVQYCFRRVPETAMPTQLYYPHVFFGFTSDASEFVNSLCVNPAVAAAELVYQGQYMALFRDTGNTSLSFAGLVPVVDAHGFVVELVKMSSDMALAATVASDGYWVRVNPRDGACDVFSDVRNDCLLKEQYFSELRWLLNTKTTASSSLFALSRAPPPASTSTEQLISCTDKEWSLYSEIVSSLRELVLFSGSGSAPSPSRSSSTTTTNPLVSAVVLRRTRDLTHRVITAMDLRRRLDDACLSVRECDGFVFDVLLRGSPSPPALDSLPPEWHPKTYYTSGDAGFLSILYLLQWRSTVQRFLELALTADFASSVAHQPLLRSLLAHFRVGILWESSTSSSLPTCSDVRVTDDAEHIFFFNPSRESMLLKPLRQPSSSQSASLEPDPVSSEWVVTGSLQTQYAKERDSVVAFFMAQALAVVTRVVRSCSSSSLARVSVESVLVGMYIGSQQDVDLKHTYKHWQRVVREFRQTIPSRKRRAVTVSPPVVVVGDNSSGAAPVVKQERRTSSGGSSSRRRSSGGSRRRPAAATTSLAAAENTQVVPTASAPALTTESEVLTKIGNEGIVDEKKFHENELDELEDELDEFIKRIKTEQATVTTS
jgi:hypothetical protein